MINERLNLKWLIVNHTEVIYVTFSFSHSFILKLDVHVGEWLNVPALSPIYVDLIEFWDRHWEDM